MFWEIGVAIGLLLALIAGSEAGYRAGISRKAGTESGQIGTIQAAMLGLLALLLAFSFATSTTLLLERQDLITEEANAIGTSYLRADLLEEPHRSSLKSALHRYVDHRLAVVGTLKSGWTPEMQAETSRLHGEIWKAASGGASGNVELVLSVLPPVNDVIDLHTSRIISGKKHVPRMVVALLIISSVLSMVAIGFGSGLAGRRNFPLCLCLSFLIASTLWIIIDLDHPRSGIMQLNDMPLRMLQEDMKGG